MGPAGRPKERTTAQKVEVCYRGSAGAPAVIIG
jgi:hypothetical protein